jgi:VWFA-related protein
MRLRLRTASRTLLIALLAGPLPAQAPAPSPTPSPRPEPPRVTFGVEVAYVEVDAIVTDGDGRPVRDLGKDDFVVLENGKPQALELFSRIDIPYERPEPAAPPPIEPDVATNEVPFDGRIYIIVLDDLHTSPTRSLLVRAAARRFLDRHFAEGDLAAVVHTGAGQDAGQELTGSRRLLRASTERFIGRKLPSVTLSRAEEYRRTRDIRQPDERVNDPDEAIRAQHARSALDTLRNVADWLSTIHGRRKAVLFLSEGLDYDLYDSFNNRGATTVLDAFRSATAAATRANVSFYAVDPRGLGGLSSEMMEIQPVFEDPSLGLTPQALDSDFRRSQDSLRVLADETSGQAAVNTNDFEGAFDRLVKDSSVYYMLGYYPASQKRDGRVHKLEVKVTRPGLRVRARQAYTAPRGKRPDETLRWVRPETPAPLAALLRNPLSQPGLSMTVQSAAFKGAPGRGTVMVAVQVAGNGFRFIEKDGQSRDTLELSVAAVDADGKIAGADQKIALDLKPQTLQLVQAGGFRVLSWLDLAPGRYQVRVAGRSVNSNAAGSVHSDLEVPDFGKETFALSGIALTSGIARHVPTAGPLNLLKDVLPGAPTTWRMFLPSDTLALVTEIYDREEPAHTIDVVTTLTGADGVVAYRNADERAIPARRESGPRPAILHTAQIPLTTVAPGTYTLRVEATSRMGRKPPTAARALVLQVLRPDGRPADPPAPPPAAPGAEGPRR